MKNKIKLFGVIALVAIIGFSMAACGGWDDDDDGGGGGGGGDRALVGTWFYSLSGVEELWTFNANGTYLFRWKRYSTTDYVYHKGDWSVEDSYLGRVLSADPKYFSYDGNSWVTKDRAPSDVSMNGQSYFYTIEGNTLTWLKTYTRQ